MIDSGDRVSDNGRSNKPIHPDIALGFVLLTAGLLAWMWLGDWRWAVTGAAALVAAAVCSTARFPGPTEEFDDPLA